MTFGFFPRAQLSAALDKDLMERPALVSILSKALSERALIHSDVQIFSGFGAVAQDETDAARATDEAIRINFFMTRYNLPAKGIQTEISDPIKHMQTVAYGRHRRHMIKI